MSEAAVIEEIDYVDGVEVERGLVNGSFRKDDCRNIKWSKSMLESFDDIKSGRYKVGDINNFWRIGED